MLFLDPKVKLLKETVVKSGHLSVIFRPDHESIDFSKKVQRLTSVGDYFKNGMKFCIGEVLIINNSLIFQQYGLLPKK